MKNNNISTSNGIASTMPLCTEAGIREKTRMKLSKYNASGATHSRGMEAMSVVIYVVAPSIRLDGTNARITQRNTRVHVTSPVRMWLVETSAVVIGAGVFLSRRRSRLFDGLTCEDCSADLRSPSASVLSPPSVFRGDSQRNTPHAAVNAA